MTISETFEFELHRAFDSNFHVLGWAVGRSKNCTTTLPGKRVEESSDSRRSPLPIDTRNRQWVTGLLDGIGYAIEGDRFDGKGRGRRVDHWNSRRLNEVQQRKLLPQLIYH
ncbi:hypothetical protein EVAR_4472_1 [Eumeta japonica]|uniref:Uncharacterized protein n=1 Tax=Eumeta variegata TaxID=151549 RepID=A0A4C1SXY3_EUMVA|nr:hypothetical protein EVAR_4472_1 [Eumeta japonica]